MTDQNKTYNERLAGRLQEIMNILGMTVSGFAEFIGRSPSHIYGILQSKRTFSHALADHIGKKINTTGAKILNLNISISQNIAKVESVVSFKEEYTNVPEYFSDTKNDRSIDAFISEVLVGSSFLKTPRYLKEIEAFIESQYSKTYIGDQLSKALRYSVTKDILRSKKKPIKLKNGNLGKRLVDIYWIE